MTLARRIAASVLGVVFFVAGIHKLMDPVGTSLIVAEYLKFFHLTFLNPLSKIFGVVLSFAESGIGIALVTGVLRRGVALVSGIMIQGFTLITALLAIFNPPMDCGCFGEWLHLTHTQTLVKNIVLLVIWFLAFFPFHDYGEPRRSRIAGFSLAILILLSFGAYSLFGLPLRDYTAYAPGVELSCEDDPYDEDAVMLSFFDSDWQYRDSEALYGEVMIVSVYDVRKADWQSVSQAVEVLSASGFKVLVLASDSVSSDDYAFEAVAPVYFADRRDLLAFNRANGGITYLSDGLITAKWPRLTDAVVSSLSDGPDAILTSTLYRSRFGFQALLLLSFAAMLLI